MLTPSRISAWLECDHYMTLRDRADAGLIDPDLSLGGYARLLMSKGDSHERDQLAVLIERGLDVFEVPDKRPDENFSQWCDRSVALLHEGHEVLYQFPLRADGVRGVADFLIRVETPSSLGSFSYEPVDAKLTRTSAKVAHVLQLCFYAEAITALQGVSPAEARLFLGSGETETIPLAGVEAYWRRLRHRLCDVLVDAGERPTEPEPCGHCTFCEFDPHCTAQWRSEDALHFVAGINLSERQRLESEGVETMEGLAERSDPVDGIIDERYRYLHQQAQLQRRGMSEPVPPHEVLDDTERDPQRCRLPEPNPGDVFLDFEGHPFWTPSAGLFFLMGWISLDSDHDHDTWVYHSSWAHSRDEEATITAGLIDWLVERHRQFPGMHIYHYNHTERSALVTLAALHGAGEEALERLIDLGVFVDLLDVVRQTVQIGAESYGLKYVERVAGYERRHGIDDGAGAVVGYEKWLTTGDDALLDDIARYNDDDVRATLAVRDWLLAGPLHGRPWRDDPVPGDEESLDYDELIGRLMQTGDPDHRMLGHLLGYWNREGRAHWAQFAPLFELDAHEQLDHLDVIGGLRFIGYEDPAEGKRARLAVFSVPTQQVTAPSGGVRLMFPTGPDTKESVGFRDLNLDAGELRVTWKYELPDPDSFPVTAMVVNDWVGPGNKPVSLELFAERLLAGETNPADALRLALLRRNLPVFAGDNGPAGGVFPSDIGDLAGLVVHLESSCLAIQGPPGTGKTYSGARLISALVAAGRRVGICAFSHNAIDNLIEEVLDVDHDIKVLRQHSGSRSLVHDRVTVKSSGSRAIWDRNEHQVFGGTTWAFANPDMIADPCFDVLVIDEAGQLGLADALAAMGSARAVILLGDPLQLPQVTKASHPEESGASVLEYLIGAEATIAEDRGVFLEVSRRMHDSICSFISTQLYDGRLTSFGDCARQSVGGAAGLRWIRAEHSGREIDSPEEADIVARLIRSLVGQTWVDDTGDERPLEAADVMVVVPYNAHLNLVRVHLDQDPITAAARVGTVDKFQGQEAPVVVFSMATSSQVEMPRNLDFLFSRHRLNVAISRARALAYVTCTEELLNAQARTVEEMHLIGMLCAFVDQAEQVTV